MNRFVAERFAENIRRLALGLEPIDAALGTPVAHPLRVMLDDEVAGLSRPVVARHASCRHVLMYDPALAARVTVRVFEEASGFLPTRLRDRRPGDPAQAMRSVPRRFVPRRLSYPLPDVTGDVVPAGAHRLRIRRPFLFPGAAYDLAAGLTGLRGRVVRDGTPVRWARIEAAIDDGDTVVGRAHGDDRGEFLLLVSAAAGAIGDLEDPLTVQLTVAAPADAPVPEFDGQPDLDPFWDLPVEEAEAIDIDAPDVDAVSTGEELPEDYVAGEPREFALRLGVIHSEREDFEVA